MALRIIILDDDSQVGSALFELVDGMPGLECRVIPARLLSTSPEGVLQRVRVFMPHYVVNSHSIEQALAAEGVDWAHLRLAKMLCQDCRSCGAAMIHLSSALVFEGARGHSFSEADKPRPRRAPGRRLLELERIVERHSDRYIILRTGWMFGANRQSSFVKLLERLERGENITLRRGLLGAPTSSADVARVVWAMIQQLDCGADCWGIFHYTSGDSASSREFAETVITLAAQYGELDVDKLQLAESNHGDSWSVAAQPVLTCHRILNDFGIKQRPWRSAMTTMLKAIYSEDKAVPSNP